MCFEKRTGIILDKENGLLDDFLVISAATFYFWRNNKVYFSLFHSIPYTAIQSATSQRRMFHLVYLSLDGEETSLNFKLDSSQSASGLYRAITEKHAFYSCETVRSAVTAQFIRDLKVVLLAYLLEYHHYSIRLTASSSSGHYNLDIQRGLDVRKEIRVRHT